MNWKIKGVVQAVLSALPGGVPVNSVLQRTAGNLRNFEKNVDAKVTGDWLVLLSHMRDIGVRPQGLDYLEVGTGWYPTLPVCYFLIGANSCRTYDIRRHLSAKLTWKMLRRLEHHLPAIADGGGMSIESVRLKYEELLRCNTLEHLLGRARIEYIAPGDASRTSLPAESIDVVFSNSVLEHVPAESIRKIMKESYRVLKPGGLVIHSANCGDHYAYCDRKITAINYLLYSEKQWRMWNNPLQYQNRLRPEDFLAVTRDTGFRVILAKHKAQEKLLEALERMKVAPEFVQYSPEQLAATSIDFVGLVEDKFRTVI
ncbi:MAG: class I SAM-dependent methyltransferase [Bryobacteraceae bacterium]